MVALIFLGIYTSLAMVKKKAKGRAITLRDILHHIQAMKGEVLRKIDGLEKRMGGLENRMGGLEQRVERVEKKVNLISVQIQNIDERLDDLEVQRLPVLEERVLGRR